MLKCEECGIKVELIEGSFCAGTGEEIGDTCLLLPEKALMIAVQMMSIVDCKEANTVNCNWRKPEDCVGCSKRGL